MRIDGSLECQPACFKRAAMAAMAAIASPPPSRRPPPAPAVITDPATGPGHGRQRSPPAHPPAGHRAAALAP